MRKGIVLLAVIALALPVLAARVETGPALSSGPVTALTASRDDNHVYQEITTNGYYNAFTSDFLKGQLCYTTEAGAWVMNKFHIGVYVPGAGDHTINVEFWNELDPGDPFSGGQAGAATVQFSTTGAGSVVGEVDLTGLEIPIAGPNVWMFYDNPGSGYGVLHVDKDASDIGYPYYGQIGGLPNGGGWIQVAGDGSVWWYWYGGVPNADIYIALNAVPEPASLALLALGGLALIRRR